VTGCAGKWRGLCFWWREEENLWQGNEGGRGGKSLWKGGSEKNDEPGCKKKRISAGDLQISETGDKLDHCIGNLGKFYRVHNLRDGVNFGRK
jgi:hypothetical protein